VIKKIIVALILFLLTSELAQAEESISRFVSEVTLNQDTSLSIQETITYQTDEQHHGIYRYVPYRYSFKGFKYNNDVVLEKITDESGLPYNFQQTKTREYYTWKIGDADILISGTNTYVLDYKIYDLPREFEDHDEVYLDITGEGWKLPVEFSEAIINSPFAKITQVKCFSGSYGSEDDACSVELVSDSMVKVWHEQPVVYGNNFTVVISLDKDNQLVFPTQTERWLKTFKENIWIIVMLLPTVVMFYLWYSKGRDQMFLSPNIFDMSEKPTKLKPLFFHERIPMVYQPLTELTPGEAGAILDEKVDSRDVISEIIDLARKKYLKIVPISSGKFIFKSRDFVFIKLKEGDETLPAHQKYLHDKIFKTGGEVKMSKLKGTFYTTMSTVEKMIYESAMKKKLFINDPNKQRLKYVGSISALIALVYFLGRFLSNSGILPAILAVPQSILAVFFARGIIQKSARGYNYYMQAKGLRETIKRGAWREKIHEKRLFFDEVLPFAVAFNVVDKLSKDMESLSVEAPTYLAAAGWNSHSFSQSLNNFGSRASSTLSYNPSSSRSSSSSGFSSGGGFSGGGGGGGGGGSW